MKGHVFDEIARLCGGNGDAMDLIHSAWAACETWDDLVDRDKPVADAEINKLLIWALFGLQQNPVYRQHPPLALALRVTVSNWMAANRLERSADREQLVTAYTLRCCPYDFFVAVILCVSGPEMADEAAHFFRSAPGPDTLDGFLAEHDKD